VIVPFVETCDRLAIRLVELRMDDMRFMTICVIRPRTIYGNRNVEQNGDSRWCDSQYIYIYIWLRSMIVCTGNDEVSPETIRRST
jgi:hypothetical protein